MPQTPDDSFELYDLKVEVVAPPGARLYCGASPGDFFELRGEMLHLPAGQGFSIYSLAAVLPLLAAKQRETAPNDWVSTDAEVIIDDFGGWALFQELLRTVQTVARKHDVSIAAIATRWVLDRTGVAAVIVGARYAHHLDSALGMFRLSLDEDDRAAIDAVLARRRGPGGDTYALERHRHRPHGRIMKYNLNKV